MAGVRLGVYAALAEGPATAEALAARLKLSPEGTRALLEAPGVLRGGGAQARPLPAG